MGKIKLLDLCDLSVVYRHPVVSEPDDIVPPEVAPTPVGSSIGQGVDAIRLLIWCLAPALADAKRLLLQDLLEKRVAADDFMAPWTFTRCADVMVLATSSPSTAATVCLVLTETRGARLVAAVLPVAAAFGRVEATPLEPKLCVKLG